MFKKALLLAIATTVMAGCAAPAGSSFVATNGTSAVADASKAVTAAEKSKADSLLDKEYPAFQYPTRSPFHSVSIPGSAYSPVSKADAGLSDLQLAHTSKADELSFKGIAKTQGTVSGAKFLVSGTVNLATGKVAASSISFIP